MSLIHLNIELNSQIRFMTTLQEKVGKLSGQLLFVERKINSVLMISQKIENDQNYMLIFYICRENCKTRG